MRAYLSRRGRGIDTGSLHRDYVGPIRLLLSRRIRGRGVRSIDGRRWAARRGGWQTTAGSNNQLWNFTNLSSSTYNLAVNLGAYCLDDMGGASGTQDAVWACNGGANQKWAATAASGGFHLVNGAGLCLDVNGGGNVNGTKVVNWTCGSTDTAEA